MLDLSRWLKNMMIEDYVNKKVATVHLSDRYDLVVYVVHAKSKKEKKGK